MEIIFNLNPSGCCSTKVCIAENIFSAQVFISRPPVPAPKAGKAIDDRFLVLQISWEFITALNNPAVTLA